MAKEQHGKEVCIFRLGVSEDNINAIFKGQRHPIESNATEEGKAKNRRNSANLN